MKRTLYVGRAGHFQPVFKTLDRLAVPTDKLLEGVGLSRDAFSDPENLIPGEALWQFMQDAADWLQSDDLGFQVLENSALDDYGHFATGLTRAPNLYQAIRKLVRNLSHHSNALDSWLHEDAEFIWICRPGIRAYTSGQWVMEQHAIGFYATLVRAYADADWTPKRAWLQAQWPSPPEGYTFLRDTDVLTEQDYTALAVEKALLLRTPRASVADESPALEEAPTALPDTLKEMMRQHFFGNAVSVEGVAQKLGVNVRTLQRRLLPHHTTVKALIEEVKFEQACNLLEQTDYKTADIAQEMGYYDLRGFVRAFRRWCGHTPADYRRQRRFERETDN